MNIFEKLNLVTLENNSQAVLARYLLDLDNYENISIQQLVDNVYVSSATATRLAKKVGLTGFAELKYTLIQETKSDSLSFYQTIFSADLITKIEYDINKKFKTLESFNKIFIFTYSNEYDYLKYLHNIEYSTDYSKQKSLLKSSNTLYIFITNNIINEEIISLSNNVANKLIISTSPDIAGDINVKNSQSLITMIIEYIAFSK